MHFFAVLLFVSCNEHDNKHANLLALDPPVILFNTTDNIYKEREWQGVPTIEHFIDGSLWAAWYSGGEGEGKENYVTVSMSNDKGLSWQSNVIIIDPQNDVRAFDPVIWHNPNDHKLYIFWAQSYGLWDGVGGVWYISSANPKNKESWSAPARIYDGIMINKPMTKGQDEIFLPISIWENIYGTPYPSTDVTAKRGVNVVVTKDFVSLELRSIINLNEKLKDLDEPQFIEINDTLQTLMRTSAGIYSCFSMDEGFSWSDPAPIPVQPSSISRFHIRKNKDGSCTLIKNSSKNRVLMTAYFFEDGLNSNYKKLVVDERGEVSYPDATEDQDGIMYIIYDYQRFAAKEIIVALVGRDEHNNFYEIRKNIVSR